MGASLPKCPSCHSSDNVRKGTVPRGFVPPGHPVVSVLVGAVKLAHKLDLVNFYGYYCNKCSKSFDT
jgi:hypothetical protein